MEENNNKKKRKLKALLLYLIALAMIATGVYYVFFYRYTERKRQKLEEDLAHQAIADFYKPTETNTAIETESETEIETIAEEETRVISQSADDEGNVYVEQTFEYRVKDDNYWVGPDGITYTPDYAVGSLFCVIEYEKVGITRGVYQGSQEQNQINEDKWIPVLENIMMMPLYTQVTISAHNSTTQGLSFNNLKNSEIGDTFRLYIKTSRTKNEIYEYRVCDIYSMSRDAERRGLCNYLGLDPKKCYLTTCGRADFYVTKEMGFNDATKQLYVANDWGGPHTSRYLDYIVEADLIAHYEATPYGDFLIKNEEEWRKDK